MRLAAAADAEAIRTIYNREVVGSTVTFDMVPRTLEDQVVWLQARSGAHAVVVAEDGTGAVCGFGSLSPVPRASGLLDHRRGLGLRGPGAPGPRASAACS